MSTEMDGVALAIDCLNNQGKQVLNKLSVLDPEIERELGKNNFWSNGGMVVKGCSCTGIVKEGLQLRVDCRVQGKDSTRDILASFPGSQLIEDEVQLKRALVTMSSSVDCPKEGADIVKLKFGESTAMPSDFLFNNVPHSAWVRAYLYDQMVTAVRQVVEDPSIPNKSKLQMRVNFPEVNPKYDTYRIGTILEMVREVTLALTEENGLRVRVCVQQPLGEGIFVGVPLPLSSLRAVMERMDWGKRLTEEQKFRPSDNKEPRSEALIRLGGVGPDYVAEDDDMFIIIAPQNIIGGEVIGLLEDMVKKADGRPVILFNPSLEDKPSSNNKMQIRGRAERRSFADSFVDFYAMRLLYPSNGGYMFPIRGMIAKRDFHAPWCVYEKQGEMYEVVGAFDPYVPPSPAIISKLLT